MDDKNSCLCSCRVRMGLNRQPRPRGDAAVKRRPVVSNGATLRTHRGQARAPRMRPPSFGMNESHKEMLIDVLRHVASGGSTQVNDTHFNQGKSNVVFVRNSPLSRFEVAQVVFERLGFAGPIVSAYIASRTAAYRRECGGEGDETAWLPEYRTIVELQMNEPFLDSVSFDLFATTVNAGITKSEVNSDENATAQRDEEWTTVCAMFDDVLQETAPLVDDDSPSGEDGDDASGDDGNESVLRLNTLDDVPINVVLTLPYNYPADTPVVVVPSVATLTSRARKTIVDAAVDCIVAHNGGCCLIPLIAGLKDVVSGTLSAPAEEAQTQADEEAAREARRKAASAPQIDASPSVPRREFLEQLIASDKSARIEAQSKPSSRAKEASGEQKQCLLSNQPTPSPVLPGPVKFRTLDAATLSQEFLRSTFLYRDPATDDRMFKQCEKIKTSGSLSTQRKKLPAFQIREALKKALQQHRVVVIGGDTGSGKTTQIPQYVLEYSAEDKKGSLCSIVCTQPRRLAATAVALRVAEERDEEIGETVGYSIRLESRISQRTRLLYCTTGILLRRLQADPQIGTVSHVVVDEIHERGVDTDFLLILLRDLLQKRSDLTVVLMSATMDATKFSEYFGGAPILTIPGRTHPVDVLHLEQVIPLVGYVMEEGSRYSIIEGESQQTVKLRNSRHATDVSVERAEYDDDRSFEKHVELTARTASGSSGAPTDKNTARTLARMDPEKINYELIDQIVEYIHRSDPKGDGAILIFMPGMAEITRCIDELRGNTYIAQWCILLNLHSSLGSVEQQVVFAKPPRGKRKVIVGTNIMETSITIDDAVYVIDAGKFKENRYDPRKCLSQLVTCWISKASAKQRTGRAGRVRPGVCYRLYTTGKFDELEDHQVCEMQRVPLESLILQIHVLNLGDELTFLRKALDPPVERAVQGSVAVLTTLGALMHASDATAPSPSEHCKSERQLTSLGYHLANLPLDVRIGKMIIISAVLKCLDPVLTMAACLATKSPFQSTMHEACQINAVRRAFSKEYSSDLLSMYFAYSAWRGTLHHKGPQEAQEYTREAFLSTQALRMIQATKMQYEAYLIEAGFVSVSAGDKSNTGASQRRAAMFACAPYVTLDDVVYEAGGKPYNSNSSVVKCVVACLVAGLYPNVAKLSPRPPLGSGAPHSSNMIKANTKDGSEVWIHPSSVNGSRSSDFVYPFICYVEKIKTSQTFVRETTMVSPYALVLFGGPSTYLAQYGELVFDNWISFACLEEDAVLLMRLREQLESALTSKINDPTIEWESTAGNVVRAMERLLKDEGRQSLVTVDRRHRTIRYQDPQIHQPEPAKKKQDHKGSIKLPKRRQVTCFNCAETGHIARDCTTRPHGIGPSVPCFICGARAHYPLQCPVILPNPVTSDALVE